MFQKYRDKTMDVQLICPLILCTILPFVVSNSKIPNERKKVCRLLTIHIESRPLYKIFGSKEESEVEGFHSSFSPISITYRGL